MGVFQIRQRLGGIREDKCLLQSVSVKRRLRTVDCKPGVKCRLNCKTAHRARKG